MQPMYKHTQTGTVILILLGLPLPILLAAVGLGDWKVLAPPLIIILIFMLFTMVLFGSLTVQVDREQVRLHFGPGLLGRSFAVSEIREVEVVRNSIGHGLGIHFIRGGMIYNVSGLGGVELRLKNGGRFRIGSDEPEALARAIEEAVRLASG